MDSTAAFFWNSTEKKLSYMVINSNLQTRVKPQTTGKLKELDSKTLKNEISKMIKSFYDEIEKIFESSPNHNITVEWKIVNSGNPAPLFNTKLHKPSDSTNFVSNLFDKYFNELKEKYPSLRKAKEQYRGLPDRIVLNKLKIALNDYGLVENKRGNSYLHHLWALALHLTKSTCDKKIKSMKKLLIPDEQMQIKPKKRQTKS
ncbi:TPA: hypothetical protein F8S43_04435 [Legionella pneumophila]|nr:hypothetical protein [Legionella pneumophila]